MRDEIAMSIFPSFPEASWIKNRFDGSDTSEFCGDKMRGTRVLSSKRVSKLRLNGSFTRKTELTNKVEMISMGARELLNFLNEMMIAGGEANRARWNILMFSTATF